MGFGTHPHDNMEIITIPLKAIWHTRIVWGIKPLKLAMFKECRNRSKTQ
jgi:hypothetical protein